MSSSTSMPAHPTQQGVSPKVPRNILLLKMIPWKQKSNLSNLSKQPQVKMAKAFLTKSLLPRHKKKKRGEHPSIAAKEGGGVDPTPDTVDAAAGQGEGTDTAVEPSNLENGESSAAVEANNIVGETATDNLPEMEATPATPDATTGVDRAEPPLPSAPDEVPTAENSTSMEQPPGEDDGDS